MRIARGLTASGSHIEHRLLHFLHCQKTEELAISIEDPISLWLDELRAGDELAAAGIWNHFCLRLYETARHKIRSNSRRVYDEQDAAQSAFHSVCAGITAGRFPELHDREGLWRLLLVITSRKVMHRHRYDKQQRRDVRRTEADLVLAVAGDSGPPGMQQIPAREPTPEFAAEFAETCESLFEGLDDPKLREIVSLRMEGYSDLEIAGRLQCSRSTVQRKLEIVRRHWQRFEEAQS